MTIFQFSSDFYQRAALGGRGEIVTGGDFPALVEKKFPGNWTLRKHFWLRYIGQCTGLKLPKFQELYHQIKSNASRI